MEHDFHTGEHHDWRDNAHIAHTRVSGIFTGLIVLLISGLISYATFRLYILHISIR